MSFTKKEKEKARMKASGARRSGKLTSPTNCQCCGRAGQLDMHHEDYSKPFDVQWLCRSCHMYQDGRMDAIHSEMVTYSKIRGHKPCVICRRIAGALRKGRCHACNEYLRRHGRERPYTDDGREEKSLIATTLKCLRCDRLAGVVGRPIRGYCTSCYTYLWRKKALN